MICANCCDWDFWLDGFRTETRRHRENTERTNQEKLHDPLVIHENESRLLSRPNPHSRNTEFTKQGTLPEIRVSSGLMHANWP